jgi:ATP-binding cassette subfamily B protein
MRRVVRLMRPYRIRLIAALALAVCVVVSTLYVPVLSGRAVDALLGAGRVDFGALSRALVLICVALLVTAVSQWTMNALTNQVAYGVVRDLRVAAFDKLQTLPLSYIDSHGHGDLVSRIVTDIDQFSNGILMAFAQFFTGILTIAITLFFMFSLSVPVALVVVCLTPLSVFAAGFIARKTYAHFRVQSERRGAMTSIVEEMVGGISTVEAFGMEGRVCARFEEADESLREASFKATFFSSTANPTTRFVNALVYAGIGVFGSLAALGGLITVGGLTAFLGYASQYSKPFNEISGVVTELQNSVACAQRVFDLLDEADIVPDAPEAVSLGQASGAVELESVSFSYTPDHPLIEGLDLQVEPGQRIAIVGPTGCGKTTIINLLMRFYEVDAGSIRVDGHDIRDVRRSSLRENWGMVLQDTWVKSGTVAENIALGRPGATREEIERAGRDAYADAFVRRLPHGYDTTLGEGDAGLSAGERQLLCIARVMLAVPPMLILDEATSSIDTRTELCIQRAFDKLMEGRTSFVVAHRLSTIRDADLILAMRDGRIVERGTHEELLAANGFYASIYNAQFQGSE